MMAPDGAITSRSKLVRIMTARTEFFETLASLSESAHLVQIFHSTIVRAHVPWLAQKGARRPGVRAFARRHLNQNPFENRQTGPSPRLSSHGG
jgi:hypothetical protein